jgi:hypothetical protein
VCKGKVTFVCTCSKSNGMLDSGFSHAKRDPVACVCVCVCVYISREREVKLSVEGLKRLCM